MRSHDSHRTPQVSKNLLLNLVGDMLAEAAALGQGDDIGTASKSSRAPRSCPVGRIVE